MQHNADFTLNYKATTITIINEKNIKNNMTELSLVQFIAVIVQSKTITAKRVKTYVENNKTKVMSAE